MLPRWPGLFACAPTSRLGEQYLTARRPTAIIEGFFGYCVVFATLLSFTLRFLVKVANTLYDAQYGVNVPRPKLTIKERIREKLLLYLVSSTTYLVFFIWWGNVNKPDSLTNVYENRTTSDWDATPWFFYFVGSIVLLPIGYIMAWWVRTRASFRSVARAVC